jgi:predicted PurR-regulated permease PerM
MNARTKNIILIVSTLLVGFLAWYFRSIVTYILISAVFSVMGRPIVRWLTKIKIWKIKFGVSFSAFVALVAMWGIFFGFFRFMIPVLVSKFAELANVDVNQFLLMLEEPVSKVSMFIYGKSISLTDGTLMTMMGEKVSTFFKISQITDLFGAIVNTLGSLMIGVFSVSFITFFFLRDENMFRSGLMLLTPTGFEERVTRMIDKVSYLLRRYFIGLLLEIFLVMLLVTIGLLIVGLDFTDALVIGMLCGLFNVIPYLGPWIGAFVGILIGLALNLNSDFMGQTLPMIVYMIIVFSAVQLIDNNLFQPLIYSNSIKAHPLEIFLVIMAAGSFAGVLGMILAIPVYTILRAFASEFLSELKIVRKLTANMDKAIDQKLNTTE